MNRRRLTLRREDLTELTTDQLGAVAGGSEACIALSEDPVKCDVDFTQPVAYCLTLAGPRCIF